MNRSNPYEAAFEAYLASAGLCYVGVDEKKRSLLGDEPVKNLDFIVLGASGARLLVDIKGRRFPGGPAGKQRFVWENWSTREDIDGMTRWKQLFGSTYVALFVFLYRLGPTVQLEEETADLWTRQEQRYLLRAVTLEDYVQHMKVRSRRWGTVCLPGAMFRSLVRPFRYYSHELVQAEEDGHGEGENRRLLERTQLALQASAGGSPKNGGDWR